MPVSEVFFWVVCLILILAAAASRLAGKLTVRAAVAAVAVGLGIYLGGGITGLAMLGSFFGLATWATGHGQEKKARISGTRQHQQQREIGQVLANGGLPALLGLAAFFDSTNTETYRLLMAAALSSATADTISSEMGMVYGKNAYEILGFRKAQPGANGVVSLEGTLFGLLASTLIAFIFGIGAGFGFPFAIIVIAGTLGNLADSLLGATLEKKGILKNDMVNFLNTLIAAFFALLLWCVR